MFLYKRISKNNRVGRIFYNFLLANKTYIIFVSGSKKNSNNEIITFYSSTVFLLFKFYYTEILLTIFISKSIIIRHPFNKYFILHLFLCTRIIILYNIRLNYLVNLIRNFLIKSYFNFLIKYL